MDFSQAIPIIRKPAPGAFWGVVYSDKSGGQVYGLLVRNRRGGQYVPRTGSRKRPSRCPWVRFQYAKWAAMKGTHSNEKE